MRSYSLTSERQRAAALFHALVMQILRRDFTFRDWPPQPLEPVCRRTSCDVLGFGLRADAEVIVDTGTAHLTRPKYITPMMLRGMVR